MPLNCSYIASVRGRLYTNIMVRAPSPPTSTPIVGPCQNTRKSPASFVYRVPSPYRRPPMKAPPASSPRIPLGDVERAQKLAKDMTARAAKIGHVGSAVYGHFHVAAFEVMRREPVAAVPHIEALIGLAGAHEMPMWSAYGKFLGPWSRRHLHGPNAALVDMRVGIAACREQGNGVFMPLLATALAETEGEAGEIDAALATIDGIVADAARSGQRWFDAESHRTRGDILLKRDPTNTAPAEEAFLTAIAIAQQQKARSFELRAALSLAKLYHSTGRHVDAHDILAPALDGFAPSPEMPEIAEGQALLAALAVDE